MNIWLGIAILLVCLILHKSQSHLNLTIDYRLTAPLETTHSFACCAQAKSRPYHYRNTQYTRELDCTINSEHESDLEMDNYQVHQILLISRPR